MRKLSEDMIMLANEIGLTEELIQKGVEQTLRIAKEKELDLSENVLVGFDMNGPMTATWDASLRPRPGVPPCNYVFFVISHAFLHLQFGSFFSSTLLKPQISYLKT